MRLALLIFQYHQPKKVTAQNLSFKKIISILLKEDEVQATGVDLTWFKNFLNEDHVKLQEIRHPLVHFKLSDDGNKGSYVSSIHKTWLTNIGNKAELDQMANNAKNLHGEFVQLAYKCEEGFEKTVELIIELMKASQNDGTTTSNRA